MFDKKIKFCAINENMLDVWPHPQPASKFIPEEYKKLDEFMNSKNMPKLKYNPSNEGVKVINL